MVAIEGTRTPSKQGWEASLLDASLQCPICLDVLCAPVSLDCSHAFCRVCLLQSARLAPDGRHCPECRALIKFEDLASHPADSVLENRVRMVVPENALAVRAVAQEIKQKELEERSCRLLPVVVMEGGASSPGATVRLSVFELRDKILIDRALEGNRRFLCTSRSPSAGDTGLIVQVNDVACLPEGKAYILGYGVQRATVRRAWVEDETVGLYYAELRDDVILGPVGAIERSPISSGRIRRDRLQTFSFLRLIIGAGTPSYNHGAYRHCLELYFGAVDDLILQCSDDSDVTSILLKGAFEGDDAMRRNDVRVAISILLSAFREVLKLPLQEEQSSSATIDSPRTKDPQCCCVQ
eukprot:TRINITY_DN64438_c0_g1_i1.p1 TRINITY_DN64438_c0_g1~~TRINITY_DN64438_c0_g1_i1.p1  ORF type:complete len:368 (+),score=35.01 TRINITY_DN64438_c0_g1_i1:47-1105(+)